MKAAFYEKPYFYYLILAGNIYNIRKRHKVQNEQVTKELVNNIGREELLMKFVL